MQVGVFRRQGQEFRGELRTLALKVELVFMPVFAGRGSMTPSHMILTEAGIEVGAAWPETLGRAATFKVRLDDPTFPAPLVGRLVETDKEDEFALIWKRPSWRG